MTISFELWSSIEHQFFFVWIVTLGWITKIGLEEFKTRGNTWAHMKKIKDTNHVLASNQSPLSCLIEWSCIMELPFLVGFLTEVSIIIISVINQT